MGDAPDSAVMAVGVGGGMIPRVPSRYDHATADQYARIPPTTLPRNILWDTRGAERVNSNDNVTERDGRTDGSLI